MGSIKSLWIKQSKSGTMEKFKRLELLENMGIQGNADQGGKRQITIISEENWQNMMRVLNTDLDPASRRANVLVTGVSLINSVHKLLKLGDCIVKIYGETKPCDRMDKAFEGLKKVMQANWNGGVYGKIIKGGFIRTGDQVDFE